LSRRSPFLLILLLTLFAWAPLLAPGYFLGAHDAKHNLFWLVQFDQGLRDGFLWPRWAPDHVLGYGYPLFTFYAPLPFYVAELFHLLGASIAGAIKITWALAFVLSGVTMYRFARRLWGQGPGFVAALLYVYAPYHFVNIYVRAALAEFVAYALLPWALHCFWDLLEQGGRRRFAEYSQPFAEYSQPFALAALSLGLILLTHSVTLILFPPALALLVLYWLLLRWRRDRQVPWRPAALALGAASLALLLAAIFLLPVIAESRYIVQEQFLPDTYRYSNQFLYLYQLFSGEWGFGNALPGPEDGMSQQLGLWLVVLGLAALPLLWRYRPPQRGVVAGFVAASLASVIATQAISGPLWALIPPLALIQFPFRLLSLAALFLSLAAAGVLAALSAPRRHLTPGFIALGLAILLASYPYTQPQHTPVTDRNQSPAAVTDFEMAFPDMRGSTAFAEKPPVDSPKRAAYLTGAVLPLAGIIAGEGQVTAVRHGAGSEQVRVSAGTPVTLQFYTYWYPGWRATANGQPVAIRAGGADALITLDLPPGEHDVRIRFGNTPLRTLAAVLSVLAGVTIAILLASPAWRRRSPPNLPTPS